MLARWLGDASLNLVSGRLEKNWGRRKPRSRKLNPKGSIGKDVSKLLVDFFKSTGVSSDVGRAGFQRLPSSDPDLVDGDRDPSCRRKTSLKVLNQPPQQGSVAQAAKRKDREENQVSPTGPLS